MAFKPFKGVIIAFFQSANASYARTSLWDSRSGIGHGAKRRLSISAVKKPAGGQTP